MTPDDHACLTSRLSAAVTAADPERALAAPLPATIGQLWDSPLAGVFVTRTGWNNNVDIFVADNIVDRQDLHVVTIP